MTTRHRGRAKLIRMTAEDHEIMEALHDICSIVRAEEGLDPLESPLHSVIALAARWAKEVAEDMDIVADDVDVEETLDGCDATH